MTLGEWVLFLLAVAMAVGALVDIFRWGLEWRWVPFVVVFPLVGPAIYFFTAYGPWDLEGMSYRATELKRARRDLRALGLRLQATPDPKGETSETAKWSASQWATAGRSWLVLGRVELAEKFLAQAVAQGVDPSEAHYELAQILVATRKDYSAALDLLSPLVAWGPRYRAGAAHLAYGRCLDELGRFPEAEKALRDAMKHRRSPEARVRLARILMRRRETIEAEEQFQAVLQETAGLDPIERRSVKAWIKLVDDLKTADDPLPPPVLDHTIDRFFLKVTSGAVAIALAFLVYTYRAEVRELFFPDPVWRAYDLRAELQRAMAAFETELPASNPNRLDPEKAVKAYLALHHALRRETKRVVEGHILLYSSGPTDIEPGLLEPDLIHLRGITAETDLLAKLPLVLRENNLSPGNVLDLAGRFEWSCLGRESAFFAALPPQHREAWVESWEQRRMLLEQNDEDFPYRASNLEFYQGEVKRLRALAPSSLPPAWRQACDQHRAELEKIDPLALWALTQALIPNYTIPPYFDPGYFYTPTFQ